MSIASVHQALSVQRAAIIQDLLVALPAEVAFYRGVPAASLAPPLGQLMDCVLQAFVELRLEDVRALAMEVFGARVAQGADVSDMLDGIRVVRRTLVARVRAAAASAEVALAAVERVDAIINDGVLPSIGPAVQLGLEQSRAALHDMSARYEELFLRAPVMMYSVDTDLRILTASNRLLEVLGYAREEVIGRRSLDFLTEASRRAAVEVNVPQIAREGSLRDAPLQYVKKSGEIIDVLLSTVVLDGEASTPKRMVTVLVEVTERLRAEQALRESEERYRAMVDLAPVGMVIHKHGDIVFANRAAARLSGVESAEALVGKTVLDITHPEEWPKVQDRVRQMQELGEGVPTAEEVFRRQDGTSYMAEVTAQPVAFEGERMVQVLFTDITARKEAEEALRQSQAQAHVIAAQEEMLRALSAPLIPLGEGVVAMPLVGRITGDRGGRLVEVLVEGVAAQGAHTAILDVTGVPEADGGVAAALGRAARAIGLLGAEVVLTGIQPAFAQALVELGVDLGGIVTRGTLRDGIAYALARAQAQAQAGAGRARARR